MSSDHVVINYLDEPARLVFWKLTDVFAVVITFTVMWVAFGAIIGLIAAAATVAIIRTFNKRIGEGMWSAIVYWHCFNKQTYTQTLPSYVRELVD